MDKKIKIEHFANIVAIAISDGEISKDEAELLKIRAIEYGIEQKEIDEIMAMSDKLEFIIPQNSEDREEQLSEAVLMSLTDGKIHEKEYYLCLKIAEKLGFDERYLNYIIELSKKLLKD